MRLFLTLFLLLQVSILTAADIPGVNAGVGSPYLFVPVGELVETVGAQLGVVVATTEAVANQAASMVKCVYQAENGAVPVVDLQQAIAKRSFFPNGTVLRIIFFLFNDCVNCFTRVICCFSQQMLFFTYSITKSLPTGTSNVTVGNDIGQSLHTSTYRARGHISAGGQYHFYMETQTATACNVDGDNIEVTCGSQYPTLYQGQIATILGVPLNKVSVLLCVDVVFCCILSKVF